MAEKLKKPTSKVSPVEEVKPEVVEEAEVSEAVAEEPKKESKKLVKGEGVKSSKKVSDEEREAMKRELLKEVMQETGAIEVSFEATIVEGSDLIAEKLNKQEKKLCVWELEEGVPKGFMEEVKINGAVARIPRGVSLYAPLSVVNMIASYKKAEAKPDANVRNRAGGFGVSTMRDSVAQERLTK